MVLYNHRKEHTNTDGQKGTHHEKSTKYTSTTTKKKFHDCYEVNAVDPVDARNIAVQRLIEETGDGLNVYEIIEVQKAD